MAKKSKDLVVVDAANQNGERSPISTEVIFGEREHALAAKLNLDVSGHIDDRLAAAVIKTNQASRLIAEAGIYYLSVKSECDHGEFSLRLADMGVDERRARESMALAQALAKLSDAHADRILELPVTKARALTSLDPEVVNAMLESGEIDIDRLSARKVLELVREQRAHIADLSVQLETAETNLQAVNKKLKKLPTERADSVPIVIADLRAEVLANSKKAELALQSFTCLGGDLLNLYGTDAAHDWADATLRLAVSALAAIRLQLDGVLDQFVRELPGGDPTPTSRSALTPDERIEAAKQFNVLTAHHEYEKLLREYEREQERPQGKGRPRNKPVAPEVKS